MTREKSADFAAEHPPGQIAPAAKKARVSNFVIVLVSIVLALLIAEVAVRLIIETDADGQDTFGELPLRPYRLPVAATEKTLKRYYSDSTSYVMYDPYLGWTHRPNTKSTNGLYRANSAGIRARDEYDFEPQPGVLRIALFGDSYTHSSEVKFSKSWGYQLEELLREEGYEAEVLNFGVGGYGMDQAYLRWQHQGALYSPDIVIFGFRAQDLMRNLNMFRSIYRPGTGVPFSKPRFVLVDGELELVNSPTVPPEQVVATLATFDAFPYVEHEFYYDDAFREHWWLKSRLVALIVAALGPDVERGREMRDNLEFYAMGGETAELAVAIVRAFEEDVRSHGAAFIIVTLPTDDDLRDIQRGDDILYADLLSYLDENYRVAHTEDVVPPDKIHSFKGHYNRKGNQYVAQVVFQEVMQLIEDGQVDLDRGDE